MNNKFILYTLKKYIPLYIITFAVCFSVFLSTFMSLPVTNVHYENGTGDVLYYSFDLNLSGSGLISIAIIMIILTTIVPFFANSYRYSLQSLDLFNQLGKKEKMIRFTNNFILLGACLASLLAASIFGIIILVFRQLPNISATPLKEYLYDDYYRVTEYIVFKFYYYIPALILILTVGVVHYFISYFLITRANNVLNSIIIMVLGEFILSIGFISPLWWSQIFANAVVEGSGNFIDNTFIPAGTISSSIGPIAIIIELFDGLITGNSSALISYLSNINETQIFSLIITIIAQILYILVGVFAINRFFKEDESSGELAGKPVGRDRFQMIIFYSGAGLIGFWVGTLISLSGVGISAIGLTFLSQFATYVSYLSSFVFYGALFYVFLGLIRRNFRLKKQEIIPLFSIIGGNLVLGLILVAVTNTAILIR